MPVTDVNARSETAEDILDVAERLIQSRGYSAFSYQDIADALGVTRPPTGRLRHIAHIGVRAMPFSFTVNGLEVPPEPVRVELTGPTGELWTWGPEHAANRVTGPALDFCLLVTQRRHRDDTAALAEGRVADQWLAIAQAFAGRPGGGRRPGQHGQSA